MWWLIMPVPGDQIHPLLVSEGTGHACGMCVYIKCRQSVHAHEINLSKHQKPFRLFQNLVTASSSIAWRLCYQWNYSFYCIADALSIWWCTCGSQRAIALFFPLTICSVSSLLGSGADHVTAGFRGQRRMWESLHICYTVTLDSPYCGLPMLWRQGVL